MHGTLQLAACCFAMWQRGLAVCCKCTTAVAALAVSCLLACRPVPGKEQKKLREQLVHHAQHVGSALGRLAPFGLQILVSGFAYSTGLALTQVRFWSLQHREPVVGSNLLPIRISSRVRSGQGFRALHTASPWPSHRCIWPLQLQNTSCR